MSNDAGARLEAEARQRHAEGDYVAALAGYEDAFQWYHARDQTDLAARAARTIGWFRGWVFGEWAVCQGWSTRAESLLERAGSRSALGWLRYGEARRGSSLEMQRRHYLEAVEIARSCGDVDLECEATAALAVFETNGARRAADDAAALLRSLGAPARTGPKRRAVLTRREEEVLALVGQPLTNPEIAQRLYISTKTVEHHVGRVLAKLGLRSRSEAAAHATRAAISGSP